MTTSGMGRVEPALGSFTTFGEMLKVLRRRARLTQRELGIAVGYSEAYITRLEGGTRLPDPSTVRALFVDALKLRPEPELARQLVELAVAAREKLQDAPVTPTTADASPSRTNLSAPLTRFIGREHELAAVIRHLGTSRLVTLTGAGGVGKTRLAIEVGAAFLGTGLATTHDLRPHEVASAAPAFLDGVWLVQLAPLADSGLVADMVATELGLASSNRPALDVLTDHLHNRRALLLLDNCEHLVRACAEIVETLLGTCPGLRVLATSREALNISGEMAWPVPSLSVDESMQLFADRARCVRPDFTLSSQNTAAVASICTRLDGIPLAIELATSRLKGLSVEQLASRLSDRFRLLSAGSRTALPRQQTLRATVDWSYNLLSEPERILLRRLSAFVGEWTMEAAEQVCAAPGTSDVLSLLLSLVDKSLVTVDERGGEARYHLLETLREYAWEKLVAHGEAGATRRQHAHYYSAFVRGSAPRGMQESGSPIQFGLGLGIESQSWLHKVELERDNLRAALAWGLHEAHDPRDVDAGIQLALWLYSYWSARGPHSEGREWVECALAHTNSSAPTQTRAQLLCMVANYAGDTGDAVRQEPTSREALAICRELGNRFDLMVALWVRTSALMRQDDYVGAMATGEEWLSVARELGNLRYAGIAMFWLGTIAMHQRDLPRAAALMDESVAIIPASEEGTRVIARFQQGWVAWCQGDTVRGMTAAREALTYLRTTRFAFGIATILHAIGDMALFGGDVTQARQHYLESLTIFYRDGAKPRVVWCLAGLAALAATEGQGVRATTLWAAADAIHTSFGSTAVSLLHDDYRERVNAVRGQLNEQTLAVVEAAGRIMSFNQIVEYALAE